MFDQTSQKPQSTTLFMRTLTVTPEADKPEATRDRTHTTLFMRTPTVTTAEFDFVIDHVHGCQQY